MRPDQPVELVAVGETLASMTSHAFVPLRHARRLELGIGGAESNVVIGAARLGIVAAWLGRVGDDEFGQLIRQTLVAEGVQVHAIVDADRPTALMIKAHRSADRLEVSYYRAASAGSALSPDDLDPSLVSAARVLHVTGITTALSPSARATVHRAIEVAKSAGVTVSVDLNYRRALWTEEEAADEFRLLAKSADIVFASADEARIAVGANEADARALLDALAELGPQEVVIKLGRAGAVGRHRAVEFTAPPVPVTEVDAVGAGDAFAAGYLATRLRGGDLVRCMTTASRVGAFAVSVHGDWEGLPTAAELDRRSRDLVVR